MHRDTIYYTYDMSDTWQHAVEIEAEVARSPRTQYPRCVASRHACLPENCGGSRVRPHVATLAGRMTADKRALPDWLAGPSDPHAFCAAEANARLAEPREE